MRSGFDVTSTAEARSARRREESITRIAWESIVIVCERGDCLVCLGAVGKGSGVLGLDIVEYVVIEHAVV